MSFITQGKTNLKYILIVIVLVVIVGGGIFYWGWINRFETKPVSICGLNGEYEWINISNCNKSCQLDEDCIFTCGCGAINKNETCYNEGAIYDCVDHEVSCKDSVCVAYEEKIGDEADQKQEVEQVHLNNLRNYIAGDAENFSRAFSEDYIDWGSGPVDITKEFFEGMFSREEFKQLRDKTPEEVVDLNNKIILGYSEILESEAYESYEGKHGFHFQEGDVFIYFPSELIPDGFSGVYRKENGIWKIVISD